MTSTDDIPEAKIVAGRDGTGSRLWLLTLVCVLLAVALFVYASRTKGVAVTVTFQAGHGISPGDKLKYRGIDVGEVVAVELDARLRLVTLTIDIQRGSRGLAREGSLFWIERPVVGLTEVRGLETLLGGTHVAVLPGHPDAPSQWEFAGLEIAPTGELPEGGVEIVLEAPRMGGLRRNVPLTYRGIRVGRVISVGLASDAATVEARCFVRPEFRHLVRKNTWFWNRSGLDFSLGMTGLRLEADSLASIAVGGIGLATPSPPGEIVSAGQRFTLHNKVDQDLLAAQPNLYGGWDVLPADLPPPVPVRVAVDWTEKSLGISRSRQQLAWALPLEGNRLLGPADLLNPEAGEYEGEASLEMAGKRATINPERIETFGGLATFSATPDLLAEQQPWPLSRVRVPTSPEDCLVVTEPGSSILLSAGRMEEQEDGWGVNLSTPIDSDRHGGALVATADGCLIGLLVFDQGRARVVAIPAGLLSDP